jgi:hypothetical protein
MGKKGQQMTTPESVWIKNYDALSSLLNIDGMYIAMDGIIYIRKLEGQFWAVGNEDSGLEAEFDQLPLAIDHFTHMAEQYEK